MSNTYTTGLFYLCQTPTPLGCSICFRHLHHWAVLCQTHTPIGCSICVRHLHHWAVLFASDTYTTGLFYCVRHLHHWAVLLCQTPTPLGCSIVSVTYTTGMSCVRHLHHWAVLCQTPTLLGCSVSDTYTTGLFCVRHLHLTNHGIFQHKTSANTGLSCLMVQMRLFAIHTHALPDSTGLLPLSMMSL